MAIERFIMPKKNKSNEKELMDLLEKVEAIDEPVCVSERNARIVIAVMEARRIRKKLKCQEKMPAAQLNMHCKIL